MSTLQLNAELYHQLSFIADDESCMRQVIKAVKEIVAAKVPSAEGYQPRSREELLNDFDEALADVKAYKAGRKDFVAAETLLDEL